MALGHMAFDDRSPMGQKLRAPLSDLERGLAGMQAILDSLTVDVMIDGKGTDEADFAYMQSKFGFADNKATMAAYQSLRAMWDKLDGGGAIALMRGTFAKFR